MTTWIDSTYSYWQAGGMLLVPMALVSVGIWAYFLRSQYALARALRDAAGLERALDRGELGGDIRTLAGGLAAHGSGPASVLRLAVEDVFGGASPREAFASRERDCACALKQDFLLLATLTAVAPLMGLLGTVLGMVETFDAVATVDGTTGNRVAAGISRALITTQLGLVVALPGVFGLARLRRLLRDVQVVVAECRTHALRTIEPAPGRGGERP